jgi:putative endonuclease
MDKVYIFYVYIITNYDRSVLYIGFTNNIVRRIIEHQNGFGSIFTVKYNIKYLVHCEIYKYVYDAINREKEIKGWKKQKKIDLIKKENKDFKDLSQDVFWEYGIKDFEIEEYLTEIKKDYKK